MSEFRDIEERLSEKYVMVKQRNLYFLLGGLIATIFTSGYIGYEITKKSFKEMLASQAASQATAEIVALRITALKNGEAVEAALVRAQKAAETATQAAGGATTVTANEKNIQALRGSVQDAFNQVGPEIARLQAAVTKLEEMAKKPAPAPESGKKGKFDPLTTGYREYIIKSGDTFAKIARAHGVALTDIQTLNPGVSSSSVKVGQKIKLPPRADGTSSEVPAPTTTPAPATP